MGRGPPDPGHHGARDEPPVNPVLFIAVGVTVACLSHRSLC